jgi:hypothetical protein
MAMVMVMAMAMVMVTEAAELFQRERPLGVNVIKKFSFVTDDEAQKARGFATGNPFQSVLSI